MKLTRAERGPLLGGGGLVSLVGAGLGFNSTMPTGGGGDSSPEGAGDGVRVVDPASDGEGDGAAVLLDRSARTTTTSFSLLRQLSFTPLMKWKAPDRLNLKTVCPSTYFEM